MEFGPRLRELREAAKLTQGQLAKAAGMSPGSIANLEQGFRKTPSFETLQKLASALGMGIDAFTAPSSGNALPPRGRGRPRKKPDPEPAAVKSKASTPKAPAAEKPGKRKRGGA